MAPAFRARSDSKPINSQTFNFVTAADDSFLPAFAMSSSSSSSSSEAVLKTSVDLVPLLSSPFNRAIEESIEASLGPGDDLSPEQISEVKKRFSSAFDNLVGRSFETVFKKEIKEKKKKGREREREREKWGNLCGDLGGSKRN